MLFNHVSRYQPMYDPAAVANYLIDLAERNGKPLTPMALQKLVYIAHGWHLAITGQPLLNERVEAWTWGPVIPSLYHQFKGFGSQPITQKAFWSRGFDFGPASLEDASEDTKEILNRVWEVYSKYTPIQLSNMTHQSNTPWHVTWNELQGRSVRHTQIEDDLIRSHFVELAKEK